MVRIHRFDPKDVQFADALVSSAIVIFEKDRPSDGTIRFTFGGSLEMPSIEREISRLALAKEAKWTRFPKQDIRTHEKQPVISDFFRIKRGIATGDNSYFILGEQEIAERHLPLHTLRPILPSPRYLDADEINALPNGEPACTKKLFLLDPRMSEAEIRASFPTLQVYLQEGIDRELHKRYLTSRRKPWFTQEKRDPAPIICTYLGRSDKKGGRPFRFIRNRSNAVMANVYLGMYPTQFLANAMQRDPSLIEQIWKILNLIPVEDLLGEGRVYGGGLHKLEPKELSNVPVPEIAALMDDWVVSGAQPDLFQLEAAE